MTYAEIAEEFERRNPYDCFVRCVEMDIESIIEDIFAIAGGKSPTAEQEKNILRVAESLAKKKAEEDACEGDPDKLSLLKVRRRNAYFDNDR